jgi:3-hydroxymyristoyl/3-hydroxydecanoyl-(acyl carrier protein) dehydratase
MDKQTGFMIPADHPALPGHFPEQAIVPGVVILDQVINKIQHTTKRRVNGIRKSKFLQTLQAEEAVTIELGEIRQDRVRFRCLKTADRSLLGEGNLTLVPVSDQQNPARSLPEPAL